MINFIRVPNQKKAFKGLSLIIYCFCGEITFIGIDNPLFFLKIKSETLCKENYVGFIFRRLSLVVEILHALTTKIPKQISVYFAGSC